MATKKTGIWSTICWLQTRLRSRTTPSLFNSSAKSSSALPKRISSKVSPSAHIAGIAGKVWKPRFLPTPWVQAPQRTSSRGIHNDAGGLRVQGGTRGPISDPRKIATLPPRTHACDDPSPVCVAEQRQKFRRSNVRQNHGREEPQLRWCQVVKIHRDVGYREAGGQRCDTAVARRERAGGYVRGCDLLVPSAVRHVQGQRRLVVHDDIVDGPAGLTEARV